MPWTPAQDSLLGKLTSLTWQRDPQVRHTLAEVPEGGRICDLGAGGRRVRPEAVCVDLAPGPNVDLVADAHELPFPEAHFDLVLCTGTLNLCREPERVLAECARVTAQGGLLHLEVGLFQPYNPEPEDYFRWTLAGLRLIADRAGYDQVRAGSLIGPMSAFTNSATHLAGHLFAGKSPTRRAARALSHLVFGPLKYLDALIPEAQFHDTPVAYGLFFVGKKR